MYRPSLERAIYFLKIAKQVGKTSKCLSRRIGSVLVKDGCIISTGYNGPAKGVGHCDERNASFYWLLEKNTNMDRFLPWDNNICPRKNLGYKSGEGLHLCQAAHSERNAILQAAYNGISTKDSILYCYCTIPCKDCCIELVNAGVKKIVCLKGEQYDEYGKIILEEAGIEIEEIDRSLIDEIN